MYTGSKVIIAVNRLFKAPVHPFNLQNDGIETYGEWQFERGKTTIEYFLKKYREEDMFKNKTVIDIGCGAAGKSIYYAHIGAKKVYGVEILEKYRKQAEELAQKKGLADKFEFVCADCAALLFPNEFADTVIVNDAMEHIDNPEGTIREITRILKRNGRIYINFPPYYHPMGAHLTDVIYIPWVQLFFSDKTLIESYKKLVEKLPDGNERINFRISEDKNGNEYFSYINKMTVKRFKKILKNLEIAPAYYAEVPLRKFLAPLAKAPILKELFIKTVVCVIEK